MYDEMALVAGKDMASGSFAKSFTDIDLDETNEADSIFVDVETGVNEEVRGKTSSSIATSQPRSHRKRKKDQESVEDDKRDSMAEHLGEIANALKKFTDDQVITAHLYDQVMSIEGFDEESLVAAFDYLMDHEKQAEGFMVKNNYLRRVWLEKLEIELYILVKCFMCLVE